MKNIILKTPEYLLILSVLFYWMSSAVALNPIAIGLIIVLGLQIKFKQKTVGVLIASLLMLISLYMLAALLSEFLEFPAFDARAQKFLFIGLLYFILTIVVAAAMMYKYVKPSNQITTMESHR